MDQFERVVDRIIKVCVGITMVAIVLMMVMMTAESVLRSFFNYSLMVADEFAGYFLMVAVFMGVGYCMRSHSLLRVTILYDRLPIRLRTGMQVVFDLLSLAFTLIVMHQVVRVVINSYVGGTLSISQAEIPVWIPQTIMPIGTSILILALVAEIARNTRTFVALMKGQVPDDAGQQHKSH
jgi:TRAP-type C4-dicarboxylate transport system permease small subunit